ncbi:MAG: protein phosphatase 2C domain-containing protein [Polyangiaceae bacterium]
MRSHNEDTFLVRPDLGLFLVADGMGGHQAGDIASAMVRLSVADFFEVTEQGDWDPTYEEPSIVDAPRPARRLGAAIRKANRDVYSAAAEHPRHHGMGSTVVATHVPDEGDEIFIAHVGDSRCYRIRGGEIELLTRDHSLVNEALALDPSMSAEDLSRLPSNIITRALGMEEDVPVDVRGADIREGDVFLLCSDGLSGLISNREIVEALTLVEDASEVCDLLVALANEAGGHDNITALAFKI